MLERIKKYFSNNKPYNNITSPAAMLLFLIKEKQSVDGKIDELQVIEESGYSYEIYQCNLNKLIKYGYLDKQDNIFKILKKIPKWVVVGSSMGEFNTIKYKKDFKCYTYIGIWEYDCVIEVNSKMYKEIIKNNRPDYKSIEAIGISNSYTPFNSSKYYKDYEVYYYHGSILLLWNWIKIMGSNITPHLLGILIALKPLRQGTKIKFSTLSKILNEPKDNILIGLNNLKKLKLLEFEDYSSFVKYTLNRKEIDKFSPKKHKDEKHILKDINTYYALNLTTEADDEQERIDFAQKMLRIEQPKIY